MDFDPSIDFVTLNAPASRFLAVPEQAEPGSPRGQRQPREGVRAAGGEPIRAGGRQQEARGGGQGRQEQDQEVIRTLCRVAVAHALFAAAAAAVSQFDSSCSLAVSVFLSFFRRENVCTSWLLVSRSPAPAPVRSSPRILRATKKRGSNAITTDRGLRDKRRNHVGVGERAQKIATLDGGFLGCLGCLGCLGWPIRELEETQVA